MLAVSGWRGPRPARRRVRRSVPGWGWGCCGVTQGLQPPCLALRGVESSGGSERRSDTPQLVLHTLAVVDPWPGRGTGSLEPGQEGRWCTWQAWFRFWKHWKEVGRTGGAGVTPGFGLWPVDGGVAVSLGGTWTQPPRGKVRSGPGRADWRCGEGGCERDPRRGAQRRPGLDGASRRVYRADVVRELYVDAVCLRLLVHFHHVVLRGVTASPGPSICGDSQGASPRWQQACTTAPGRQRSWG